MPKEGAVVSVGATLAETLGVSEGCQNINVAPSRANICP